MANEDKLTYTEVLYEMMRIAEQVTRLHILEEAISVAQQGEDCRPILERLADRSRFQDSENPLEQTASVMEKCLMRTLDSVLETQRKERENKRNQPLERRDEDA
jgi:hypothetical protein